MRNRIALFALLASALTFLASLFLPWRETAVAPSGGHAALGLLTLVDGGSVVGWVAIAGDVAVLLAIATALAAVAALRRPQLAPRLPFPHLGLALGYFAVAVAVEVNTLSGELDTGFTGRPVTLHTSWSYGFYLGLVSAGIALLSGLAVRRGERVRIPGAADALAVALGIGLLVSFLLPWLGYHGPVGVTTGAHGVEIAASLTAALVLILGGGLLLGEDRRGWRLPVAVAIAVLTGGAASASPFAYVHLYGTWIAIGCAVSLVALEAVRAWPARLPALPHGPAAVRWGAASLLIVALFLPWEQFHVAGASGFGTNGWYSAPGAAAGSLCLLLLASPTLPALENHVLDIVAAVVIFVSITGTAFREDSLVFRAGYGAFVAFAAAGILLVATLVPLRPGRVDPRRVLARVVPLAASVLCIAAVVVPFWFVLPDSWNVQAAALHGAFAVPGVLLGLYLVHLWARQVRGLATTGGRLILVPLVLLTLPSLDLIRFRDDSDVLWGGVILVGLCLLLVLFGWIEQDRGIESLRVPDEIWRIDRLPEAEG